jgi:hypothetical protein
MNDVRKELLEVDKLCESINEEFLEGSNRCVVYTDFLTETQIKAIFDLYEMAGYKVNEAYNYLTEGDKVIIIRKENEIKENK